MGIPLVIPLIDLEIRKCKPSCGEGALFTDGAKTPTVSAIMLMACAV